jgi:hypothetical protein
MTTRTYGAEFLIREMIFELQDFPPGIADEKIVGVVGRVFGLPDSITREGYCYRDDLEIRRRILEYRRELMPV